jgi:hypothetical protein
MEGEMQRKQNKELEAVPSQLTSSVEERARGSANTISAIMVVGGGKSSSVVDLCQVVVTNPYPEKRLGFACISR